jgi:hypothetical protein
MNKDRFSELVKPAFHVWVYGGPFASIGELIASRVSVSTSDTKHCIKIAFDVSFLHGHDSWEIALDDIPGIDALVAMRNIGLLVYGERHGLWMIHTGENTPNVVKVQGPSIISNLGAKVFWYLRDNKFVCPSGYYGAQWVHIRGGSDSKSALLGLAVNINGSWMLIQFDARTLALAMTHCGFLRPFGICQRDWQVRLPDGMKLSPLRSVS